MKVGNFEYMSGQGLIGPADYLDARGEALADAIFAGTDVIFNSTSHLSPDYTTAVLVRLQTDYAGWKGMQQFCKTHAL